MTGAARAEAGRASLSPRRVGQPRPGDGVKRFLVTGTSTGIGRATALHLAGRGYFVYAGVRRAADAESLLGADGEHILPLTIDVTKPGDISAAVEVIDADGGRLDGLVNNAGIGRGGPLDYLGLDEWREQFEVNVIGPVAVTKAAMGLLRATSGRIVFVGSILGRVAMPLLGPYCASKFALEGLAESLRHDLDTSGIAVSVIEPGTIDTPMQTKALERMDRLEREIPDETRVYYEPQVAASRRTFERQVERSTSPQKVALAIEHALTARRPKLRYRVGRDARAVSVMARLLPDRTREAAIRRFALS